MYFGEDVMSTKLSTTVGYAPISVEAFGLSDRVAGRVGDTTLRRAFALSHADEAFFTPRCTPGVLDLPEIKSRVRVSPVSNKEDAVIKLFTALAVHDTTSVKLEGHLVSFNSNGDRTNVECLEEIIFISLLDINKAGDGGEGFSGLFGVTLVILAGVRIFFFRCDSFVINDVLKAIVHETTVASLVALSAGTVNKLLFRERDKLVVLDEVGTFN